MGFPQGLSLSYFNHGTSNKEVKSHNLWAALCKVLKRDELVLLAQQTAP